MLLFITRSHPAPRGACAWTRRKSMSTARPIVVAALPRQVQLPLGKIPERLASPLVEVGDHVLTGQPVAQTDGDRPNLLCASVSGTVTAIRPGAIPGPGQRVVDCIVIDSDGEDRRHPDCTPPHKQAAEALRDAIARAGILGLGGALFPTAEKLSGGAPVDLLILNGAECEPYISCDEMLMRERAGQVIDGARIMLAALGCSQAVIAVESDMPEARVALREGLDAAGLDNVDLAEVTAKYPAGGERQLIELLTGREVPAGGLPRDVGIVCQNVATAAAVSELFESGQPLISRIVTVTGTGVAEPVNVEVRLGAPLSDLVTAAGGYTQADCQLVMGGPMMGVSVPGDQLPVTEATNCLLVATAGELTGSAPEFPCIRCAECSRVCPARLLPQELLLACDADMPERLESLQLDACIECGCCDYVCPSRIALTPRFQAAKQGLDARRQARHEAREARERSEAHTARLKAAESRFVDGPAPGPGGPGPGRAPRPGRGPIPSATMATEVRTAPHLRTPVSVPVIMRRVLYALLPALLGYIWFFGFGIVFNMAVAAATAVLTEAVCLRLQNRPIAAALGDYSAIVTAVLLAFALPPLTPWWITAAGTAFAIAVAKHAYGGVGHNPFNPAMAGYVMILVSFPDQLTNWLPPRMGDIDYEGISVLANLVYTLTGTLPGGLSLDAITRATPLDLMQTELGNMRMVAEISNQSLFGDFGGRGWEWIGNFIALGGFWLLFRGVIRWHIPVGVLGGLLLPATVFYLVDAASYPAPGFHLFSGGALLCAFFIATDPVSAATTDRGRLIFGAGIGFLTYVLRTWGSFPDGRRIRRAVDEHGGTAH